jgi:hypothetical protein
VPRLTLLFFGETEVVPEAAKMVTAGPNKLPLETLKSPSYVQVFRPSRVTGIWWLQPPPSAATEAKGLTARVLDRAATGTGPRTYELLVVSGL